MKRRFEIYNESGVDENGYPVREMVKAFKNEPEAKAFYNDQKKYSQVWDDVHVQKYQRRLIPYVG